MIKQHTPGPWHWADDKGYKWGRRGLEPNVMCGTVEGLIDVDAADALLIAASPDLLANARQNDYALETAEQVLAERGIELKELTTQRARNRLIIAAATGEA